MSRNVFYPPLAVDHIDKALYFGGILQSAGLWLDEAVDFVRPRLDQEISLLLPLPPRHVNLDYICHGDFQERWAQNYIACAADKGVIALWLPAQQSWYPEKDERFGFASLAQVQEAFARHRFFASPLAIGVSPDNPYCEAIRYRFETFCPDVVVRDNLESVCRDALGLSAQMYEK